MTCSTSPAVVGWRPEGTHCWVAATDVNLPTKRWKAVSRGTPVGFLRKNSRRKARLTKVRPFNSANFSTTQPAYSLLNGEFALKCRFGLFGDEAIHACLDTVAPKLTIYLKMMNHLLHIYECKNERTWLILARGVATLFHSFMNTL